jgi:hypothetical protein
VHAVAETDIDYQRVKGGQQILPFFIFAKKEKGGQNENREITGNSIEIL